MLTNKEEILKVIQKWSEEHGGRTPGEKVIREDLGIPKWHWITYWTKVTDMQKDAGLTPQRFDKTVYSEKDLLNKFIKLIRHWEKWPSRDELDFKRRQDPSFPASGTFYKKFDKSRGLTLALIEHVKNKNGYEDVVEICNSVLVKHNESTTGVDHSTEGGVGYVYLLKSSLRNAVAYKIGKTKDLEQRLKQLRQASNIEELVHQIQTDDIEGIEQYWLNRFSGKRLYPNKPRDEWFKLNSSDVKAFKRWKRIF